MGKKGKKKAATANDWLEDASSLKLGKRLTVENVLVDYVLPELKSKNRRPSTVASLVREVDRWTAWCKSVTDQPLPIAKIRRRHLQTFREWLSSTGHSVPLQNGAIRAVLQVMHAAEKHELINNSPKLESLHHRGVAPKIFPSDEEIDRLWQVADAMEWPTRDSKLRPLPYSPATAWRSAFVLYRCYGFRTQELVRLESDYRSITWGNIHGAGMTPNPEGRCECEFGWLAYTPQKQERMKPEPLVVPLNRYTRAALDQVSQGPHKPTDVVLDWAMSSVSFYAAWHKLCELASVKPRAASGVERYTVKHLRKAATTGINNHRPSMAEHIVGHGSDRSGQSAVSSKHYNNAEQAVLDCVLTMPVPESFKEWVQ